jgi:cytochrome c biogenesis protein CcmG, thiol:disulfide interchange protein DsbE
MYWRVSKLRRIQFFSALVLFLSLAGCYHTTRPGRIGSAAPDFSVQDSDRKVTLSQFRGQVVLVNFWATWCAPCQAELPSLISLQDRIKPKAMTVLGISIDVDEDAYHRFIKQRSVNFPTVRDPEQKVASVYGTTGWPETYIVDRNGVLRRKIVGPIDWNSSDINQFLNSL